MYSKIQFFIFIAPNKLPGRKIIMCLKLYKQTNKHSNNEELCKMPESLSISVTIHIANPRQ